ncbi:uncharacterized protein LOC143280591 [Babylonia areolata]|uniref:uncharacterized protein LOC143280591 n=1 Tax=Babylonia areolata TaxID=304850 RepID=UPI003FD61A46
MAPTSSPDNSSSSSSRGQEVPASPTGSTIPPLSSSSAAAAAADSLTAEDLDSEPFYGMFDRHADDDDDYYYEEGVVVDSCWTHLRLPIPHSPRASITTSTTIPEASETFRRAMRQLDGIEDSAARAAAAAAAAAVVVVASSDKTVTGDKASSSSSSSSGGTGKRERKSCPVKKAASFSVSDCHCSCSSSSSSSSTTSSSSSSKDALAAEARRRKSVPCMARGKHVQWADEAGVAELVSVRLIRPRLQVKGDREEGQASSSTPRSILRRLTGIH